LKKLLEKTNRDLEDLPSPPSSEPLNEVLRLITDFTRAVERQGEGIPGRDGLLHQIKQPQDNFRVAIRKTAPCFVPQFREKPKSDAESDDIDTVSTSHRSPSFLVGEEDSDEIGLNDGKEIFIDDVLETAEWCVPWLCGIDLTTNPLISAVTRELPNNYPFIVQKGYIHAFVDQWDQPAQAVFTTIVDKVKEATLRIVDTHFENYTQSRFKQRVS
jgi:hypothetical protein